LPVLECSRCNELYYSAHGSTDLACDVCGCPVWRLFEDEVSFTRVSTLARRFQPGDHAALVYTEVEEAADFCAAYLREGTLRGEHLVMTVPGDLRLALDARLAPAELHEITVIDPASAYADFEPERVADRYTELTTCFDGPIRMLCGPDVEAISGVHLDDWRRYERLAHDRILELGVTALCVYDRKNLPMGFGPVAIEGHPLLSRNAAELVRNPDFKYAAADAG
jgi:MEDS: MEthanogen/methylotroph, DcmR Sensory domain